MRRSTSRLPEPDGARAVGRRCVRWTGWRLLIFSEANARVGAKVTPSIAARLTASSGALRAHVLQRGERVVGRLAERLAAAGAARCRSGRGWGGASPRRCSSGASFSSASVYGPCRASRRRRRRRRCAAGSGRRFPSPRGPSAVEALVAVFQAPAATPIDGRSHSARDRDGARSATYASPQGHRVLLVDDADDGATRRAAGRHPLRASAQAAATSAAYRTFFFMSSAPRPPHVAVGEIARPGIVRPGGGIRQDGVHVGEQAQRRAVLRHRAAGAMRLGRSGVRPMSWALEPGGLQMAGQELLRPRARYRAARRCRSG